MTDPRAQQPVLPPGSNPFGALLPEVFLASEVLIQDLIRGAFSQLRTGFDPGERTEEKATFHLPQWPGLVWPYPIGDRSYRDPETGMLVPDTWTRRFLGVHPDILARAGLSRNQAELDQQNPPPDFFGEWMDRVANVMPSFVLGGGAMAVRSPENSTQWDVRNTYRLTVWMLLQAAALPLDTLKLGICAPGGLDPEQLVTISISEKEAFQIVIPKLPDKDRKGPSYQERQRITWKQFVNAAFPTHVLFGHQFKSTAEDRRFTIKHLNLIDSVTAFSACGHRRRNDHHKAEVVLTPMAACYAYSMRVRLLDLLRPKGVAPEDAIRAFTAWWFTIPEAESRLLLHLIFSPGERPMTGQGRRTFSYLEDPHYFSMALGLKMPEDRKLLFKVKKRRQDVANDLQAIVGSCHWVTLRESILLAINDFRGLPYTPPATLSAPQKGMSNRGDGDVELGRRTPKSMSNWGDAEGGGCRIGATEMSNWGDGDVELGRRRCRIGATPGDVSVDNAPGSEAPNMYSNREEYSTPQPALYGATESQEGRAGRVPATETKKAVGGEASGRASTQVLDAPAPLQSLDHGSLIEETKTSVSLGQGSLLGVSEAVRERLERYGLLGGAGDRSDALEAVLDHLAALSGNNSLPAGLDTVRRFLASSPWSPRGLWLIRETLARTRGVQSMGGLLSKLLSGNLGRNQGGHLPVVDEILALAERVDRNGWRGCPFGAPPAEVMLGGEFRELPLFAALELSAPPTRTLTEDEIAQIESNSRDAIEAAAQVNAEFERRLAASQAGDPTSEEAQFLHYLSVAREIYLGSGESLDHPFWTTLAGATLKEATASQYVAEVDPGPWVDYTQDTFDCYYLREVRGRCRPRRGLVLVPRS